MANQIDNYSELSKRYEEQLDVSFKKQHGIFYTDYSLASLIIDDLKIPKNAIIFDPCCGTGSFLISAIEKGFSNVYGADLDETAIKKFSKFLTEARVIVEDTIFADALVTLNKLKIDKKVDFVIGNPPYSAITSFPNFNGKEANFIKAVSSSGKNLFIAALLRAFDYLKEDGVISYIIPKNFLHVSSYNPLRKEILKTKTILSVVDLGAYFNNVRGEQVILTIRNSYPSDNSIIFKQFRDNNFINLTSIKQSAFVDEILILNNDIELSLYSKIDASYLKLKDISSGYVGRGKSKKTNAISGKDIRKFGLKKNASPTSGNKIFIQNIYSSESGIMACRGGLLDASETVTIFTDGDEDMISYVLGILHSRLCNYYLYRFCYNKSKLTMHTDAKYLKKIPLRIADPNEFSKLTNLVSLLENEHYLSLTWLQHLEDLNKLVYKIYCLSDDEIQLIEQEMRGIQSKRWSLND